MIKEIKCLNNNKKKMGGSTSVPANPQTNENYGALNGNEIIVQNIENEIQKGDILLLIIVILLIIQIVQKLINAYVKFVKDSADRDRRLRELQAPIA